MILKCYHTKHTNIIQYASISDQKIDHAITNYNQMNPSSTIFCYNPANALSL